MFFVELPLIEKDYNIDSSVDNLSITSDIKESLYYNDKYRAFVLIFKNNIKGCILNIIGGGLFGSITIFNLIYNGFFISHELISIYRGGKSISFILKKIMPHSFELLGFWLSGGVGLYFAWNLLLFIRGKQCFSMKFYKEIGIAIGLIFVIILSAAYIETYISSTL